MCKFFRQMVLQSREISPIMTMVEILVQEVNAGPPESMINDLINPQTYNTSPIVINWLIKITVTCY